jgi:hypothetical protein
MGEVAVENMVLIGHSCTAMLTLEAAANIFRRPFHGSLK